MYFSFQVFILASSYFFSLFPFQGALCVPGNKGLVPQLPVSVLLLKQILDSRFLLFPSELSWLSNGTYSEFSLILTLSLALYKQAEQRRDKR